MKKKFAAILAALAILMSVSGMALAVEIVGDYGTAYYTSFPSDLAFYLLIDLDEFIKQPDPKWLLPITGVKLDNSTLTQNIDYLLGGEEYNYGAIKIYKSAFEGLSLGKHSLVLESNSQKYSTSITVSDKFELTPTVRKFNKKAPHDIVFTSPDGCIADASPIKIDGQNYDTDTSYTERDKDIRHGRRIITLSKADIEALDLPLGEHIISIAVKHAGAQYTWLDAKLVVVDEEESGGGGCNAGFGILALLFAVPMFCRKKK